MGDRVLVAAADDTDGTRLADALAAGDVSASVTTVSALEDLFEALCFETVDCLVVPTEGGPAPGPYVVRGVRALYPRLPVVLVGDADGVADEATALRDDREPTTTVREGDFQAAEVVAAVADALAAETDSAASRPPSRPETLLQSAVDGFPMHLYAKDETARHALATGATVDLSDVIGRTDEVLTDGPPERTRRSHADDRRVIEGADPLVGVEEYTAGDDDEYAVTTKVPWHGPDGEVIGLVGITRDISERKRRERELRHRNERLAKVALVAAHELRNELQIASGRLDAVPEGAPHVDTIRRSHRRLASITDDIVDLASRERVGAEVRTVWLSTPAREVWESYDAPGAELVVEDDRRLRADPESVRIFFEIVLSNALDHAGPDVTVTVRGTDDGFVVADDGPGIEADPPDRVFDAGFAGTEDGDGFGLYVAQRIATDHGWEIRAEHSEAGGARFTVAGVEALDS